MIGGALIAGMNERWEAGQGLNTLPDDLLKALLAFDLTNPVSSVQDEVERWVAHPWRRALVEQRPELARDVFLTIARLRLSNNEQYIDGLHELLTESPFEPYRKTVVVELLRDFPNANNFSLGE